MIGNPIEEIITFITLLTCVFTYLYFKEKRGEESAYNEGGLP